MNKANLILTSTRDMNREQWLEFRQPLTHIKKFISEQWKEVLKANGEPIPIEKSFWEMDQASIYAGLKTFFKSKQWEEFLFPVIGASEVATILGLNPYKSSIELFFEKSGPKQVFDFDNVAMFWGRELEEQIANKWQYWDGTPEGMIENFANKNILRKCRRLNAYVQNKQFPWLFVSLDRVINKTKTEQEVIDEGSLECKTISGFSANMWEGGIPIMYVAQLQAQLIACEFTFGEIAILKDGRYFEVYPFDRSQEIVDRIIKDSKEFFDIVKEGAANWLLHQFAPTDELKQIHYARIEEIAPEPDGSEAYKNYLSDTYKTDKGEGITGGIVELELAKEYKYFAARIKDFETLQLERSNKLKAVMKDSPKLDFGEAGSATWKVDGRGTRSFRVNVKNEPGYLPDAFKAQPWPLNEVAAIPAEVTDPGKKEQPGAPAAEIPFQDEPVKKSRKKKVAEEADRGE